LVDEIKMTALPILPNRKIEWNKNYFLKGAPRSPKKKTTKNARNIGHRLSFPIPVATNQIENKVINLFTKKET